MANFEQIKQSEVHPHQLTAARLAQIRRWQALGAEARRGRRTAVPHPAKVRPPGTTSLSNVVTQAVAPLSAGARAAVTYAKHQIPGYNTYRGAKRPQNAPIAIAKNRLPGYNMVQPGKSTLKPPSGRKKR